MDFTYELPNPEDFLHTLRELLEAEGNRRLAGMLVGAACELVESSTFSRRRWNEFQATLVLRVPLKAIQKFSDEIKEEMLEAASRILPSTAGYHLRELEVSPLLVSPPEGDQPLNTGTLVSSGPIVHDGLKFRSRTETRIYDELKTRPVLFFPKATAVLGGKGIKREPDFLICSKGRWGILEVMGDRYHTATNAMQDHDRARLFNDSKILIIHFYDAVRCYNHPDDVVDDFLRRLDSA